MHASTATHTAALLALVVASGACAPEVPPEDNHPVGIGPLDDSTGETFTYVIDSFAIDLDDTPATPHTGFNLDGLASSIDDVTGCTYEDSVSGLDPDQNTPAGCTGVGGSCRGGVDNQLPSLVNTLGAMADYRARVSDAVARHQRVYLLRVSGVQDLAEDPGVTVALYEGLPTFSSGCEGVTPDREYLVARTSLRAGGATLDDARFRVRGRIRAGRLEVVAAAGDEFALPPLVPNASGAPRDLRLRAPRLRIDLTTTGGTRGNLGGRARYGEVVEPLCAAAPFQCPFARNFIANLVDLAPAPPLPSGLCYDTATMRYGDISIGLGFTLTRASIHADAPVADARPAGACGG